MLKRIAVISLGAAIVLAPLTTLAPVTALAQTAAPAASAPPTGSHKSQMRHRSNMSKERARASAKRLPNLLFRRLPLLRQPLRFGDLVGGHLRRQLIERFRGRVVAMSSRQTEPHVPENVVARQACAPGRDHESLTGE